MYHYVYYSYEEWGRGYIGVRSCKCLPEEDCDYMGSYTEKSFAPVYKIILSIFDNREEAQKAESVLHKFFQVHINPHFVNKAISTANFFAMPGVPQSEQHQKNKIKALHNFRETNPDLFEQHQQKRLRAKRDWEEDNSDLVKQYRSEAGKSAAKHLDSIPGAREKGLQKSHQYFRENPEAMSARGRRGSASTNKQRWQCTITGFISNSGGLTHYQRARGIDTTNRVRLPEL